MTTDVKFRENAVIAVTRNERGLTVHFRELGVRTNNGERETYTVRRLPDVVLPFERLSDAVRSEVLGYGMEVRLTRAAALGRDEKSGKSAPVQAKWDAVARLADHYKSGTDAWDLPSTGGGGLSDETKVLIEALVRVLNLSTETAEEQVRAMSSAERNALRISEEIKPAIDAIYAERVARSGGGDAKSLLERLRNAR